ncbi:MAG: ABC transporter ATP-binding protein [Patescibacteria group bacterium]
MSSEVAITVDHVWKLFHKQKQRTFKELLPALFGGQRTIESFWALNDVSFEVKKGETIGIIGPNGSGKSTLLKLMAGVTKPTNGSIKMNGRIAPLIELGAGFHPELTGRENIFLNGVILGMTREEIKSKVNDIVDFADIWDFIDQPIKHYSSGMYLRLAFAVAVHSNPEILLIDEILAVGDEAFQRKCFDRLAEFKRKRVTIVLVSHSLDAVMKFTDKAMYIENSIMKGWGESKDVVDVYLKQVSVKT